MGHCGQVSSLHQVKGHYRLVQFDTQLERVAVTRCVDQEQQMINHSFMSLPCQTMLPLHSAIAIQERDRPEKFERTIAGAHKVFAMSIADVMGDQSPFCI